VKQIVTVICIIALGISSCKKETAPTFVSYLKMNINGVPVENDSYIRASGNSPGYGPPPHLLSIAANLKPYNANKNSIEWEIFDFMEVPGEYVIPGPVGTIRYITLFQPEATFVAQSGKVTILEVDNNLIKGTFEFITKVEFFTGLRKTVTNGEFHIKRAQ
jgi:hypothetical protein